MIKIMVKMVKMEQKIFRFIIKQKLYFLIKKQTRKKGRNFIEKIIKEIKILIEVM